MKSESPAAMAACILAGVILIGGGCSDSRTGSPAASFGPDYPVQPVPFQEVELLDRFWAPRLEVNHSVTIPFALKQLEETGRMRNFDVAAGRVEGTFGTQYPFDDSDVFKVIEGASYSLRTNPDPGLEAELDQMIERISAAQEADGYLYTNRTILGENGHEWAGTRRWELVHELSHELYNLGHLFEAAVAHYQATGKHNLLDVAVRAADLLVQEFGAGREENYPGHQEVEIGLAKLYRLTGKREYLDLARFFLDVRGPAGREYNQAHLKVTEQAEAVGHAVRANYMYAGMADVAALTGDQRYGDAIDRIWNDVVSGKLYVTGGVGSTSHGEAYGTPFELPNRTAYSETCASIANVFWNHRMFLLHGDGKYLDVLERSLYNGVLAGVGISGDRFFYTNPLESAGEHERQPWFGCACCPSNLARFLPSLGGYIYARQGRRIFVNLFISSQTELDMEGGSVSIRQASDYPWDGRIRIHIDLESPTQFEVALRIPGWTGDGPFSGELYSYVGNSVGSVNLRINGDPVDFALERGFAVLSRRWRGGDEIEIELPMAVRRVHAHPAVEADRGRVSLERGPLVYCLEWPDNPGGVLNRALAEDPRFDLRFEPDLLGGCGVISAEGLAGREGASDGAVRMNAIPYALWANRGKGEMMVWIPQVDRHRKR